MQTQPILIYQLMHSRNLENVIYFPKDE